MTGRTYQKLVAPGLNQSFVGDSISVKLTSYFIKVVQILFLSSDMYLHVFSHSWIVRS